MNCDELHYILSVNINHQLRELFSSIKNVNNKEKKNVNNKELADVRDPGGVKTGKI